MGELIRDWLQGDDIDPDIIREAIGRLAESDASDWSYYDSAITDPIDAIERAALATIHGTD